jgi:phosphonate metabolism protein (transferase hexapeptide repeat family)
MAAINLTTTPTIDPTASVKATILGAYTEVGARTKLQEVELGDYSYVVNDSDIAYAKIGKFVSIAAMTRINPGNHPMNRASQSHFSYRASAYFDQECDEDEFFAWRRAQSVTIGHDVWIGHAAIVLPGRRIDTGAVIGAGSVVTKDISAYAVAVGNPARIIRQRFTDDLAARMQALAWWDWSHRQLQSALPDFRNLTCEQFLAKYESQCLASAQFRIAGAGPR